MTDQSRRESAFHHPGRQESPASSASGTPIGLPPVGITPQNHATSSGGIELVSSQTGATQTHSQFCQTNRTGPETDGCVSPFKRGFGFALVVIASSLGVLGKEGWADLIGWESLSAKLVEWGASESVLQFIDVWPRWILISLAGLWAVSFLQSRPISTLLRALFAAGLMVLSAQAVGSLCGLDLPWQAFVIGSLGIAYLIYTECETASLRLGTFVGLILVALGGIGAAGGWFDPSVMAKTFGYADKLPTVVSEYRDEFAWAIVLILSTLGVSRSRTKPVHVLNAVILAALAYHCVQSASISNGGLSEVVVWRWVLAAELALVATVVLHAALGVGGLTIAFAAVWMVVGTSLYKEIGTWSLMRTMGNEFSFAVGAMNGDSGGGRGGSGSQNRVKQKPLANWGLPVGGSTQNRMSVPPNRHSSTSVPANRAPRSSTAIGPAQANAKASAKAPAKVSATAPAKAPAKAQTKAQTKTPTKAQASRSHVSNDALEAARTEALSSLMLSRQQESVREVTRQAWMFLSAILAGLILITGFNLLSQNSGYRLCVFILLWAGFAFSIGALWTLSPREPGQTWTSWVLDWTQSEYRIHAMWTLCLGTAAIAGIWALIRGGRREKWVYTAIVSIFIGTALSLLGVAVFIRFGDFSPLPVWTYATMTIGQSSLAWVLMMHLSLSARHKPVVIS